MNTFATGNKLLNPADILSQVGLDTGLKVADFGCGNGYFVFSAAEMVGGRGQVYAVDILKSCLVAIKNEAEQHQLLNIKPIWSNIEVLGATKIPEESLDIALVVHTLYQSKKKEEFLQEVKRLLKDQGKLVVIDWKKLNTPIGPQEEERLDQAEVETIVDKVGGFKKVESFEPGKYHYGIIFQKK